MADPRQTARIVGFGLIAILLMLAVLNPTIAAIERTSDPQHIGEEATLYPNGEGTLSKDQQIARFSANQTLGDAVRFDGSDDSYLSGSADIKRDGTWSVGTWARLHDGVDTQNAIMRVLDLGGWLFLDYNQSAWRVVYYDEAAMNSYVVEVAASSPTNWSHVTAVNNGTHLTLHVNNSASKSVKLVDGNSYDGSLYVDNLNGSVEETRVYDDAINSSQRQQLIDQPVAPLKANETARIYYDARAGESSVDVYRTGADLQFNNVQLVDGFAGQTVSEDTLLTSGDYVRNGGTITTVDGGTLDGAPVVFVEYDYELGKFGQIIENVQDTGVAAFGLLIVGLLIIAANSLMDGFSGGF